MAKSTKKTSNEPEKGKGNNAFAIILLILGIIKNLNVTMTDIRSLIDFLLSFLG